MEDGLLSLKWNNHKSTFFEILKCSRENGKYTDATVAVEEKFYSVHKLVLSTCSEYFHEIFERTPCKAPVIVLKDVRIQDFESLLDYMYLGEVNVKQNELALLLRTAECLRIKGLAIPDDTEPAKPSYNIPIPVPVPVTRVPYSSLENTESFVDSPPPRKRKKEDHLESTPLGNSSIMRNNNSENTTPTTTKPSNESLIKIERCEKEDENYNSESTYNNNEQENIDKQETSKFQNSHLHSIVAQQGNQMNNDENYFYSQDSFVDTQNIAGDDDEEELDVTSYTDEGALINPNFLPLSMSLTQSRESRRCQLCQVTLANANLLRRHVEDHHFHIRKYDCVHCGKKFKRKEHRERHERIHTGEKPFACHICTSRFTQKEHLKGHIENVHNKHMKHDQQDGHNKHSKQDQQQLQDTSSSFSPQSVDTDPETSSPPSLASPSSLASLMGSPLMSLLPLGGGGGPSISTSPTGFPSSLSATETEIITSGGAPPLTALYAPHTRKSVTSPSKHVQTITINFN